MALTANGVRTPFRSISWDNLAATPDLSRRFPPTDRPTPSRAHAELDADPAFVGAAFDYYCRNSAARGAIGTPDELDRLHHVLSSDDNSR